MKVCYNYKKIFDDPIRVRTFGQFSLPMPLQLNRLILWGVFLGITYLLFSGLIDGVNQILGGSKFAIYIFFPYWVSGKLLGLNPDGQKIFPYLRDLSLYLIIFKGLKIRYCEEEIVQDVSKIMFEKVREEERV